MNIVFLDIDGVLNTNIYLNQNQYSSLDEKCVKRLLKLVNETNAKVVLHSGWRFWFCDNMHPKTSEAKMLNDLLCNHGIYLYDKTPDFSTEEIKNNKKFSLVKAQEILAWLKEHDEVKNYVVLEDLDLYNDEVVTHQVKIDGTQGLTDFDIQKAIQILKD